MQTKTEALKTTSLLTTGLFYITIFALPMITHGNQLLVGTAVNTLLFLGAQKLTKKELVPLAILPSLGAIANGVLFGSLTMFLLYFAPAIWIANYFMMIVFRRLRSFYRIEGVIVASLVKSALLFSVAFTLFKLSIVPSIFLTAMGIVQIITAVAGGCISIAIGKSKFMKE